MSLYAGFIQLGAGLSVGLAGLAAGFAIGIVGDAGVRGVAQQSRVFVGMVRFFRSPLPFSPLWKRDMGNLMLTLSIACFSPIRSCAFGLFRTLLRRNRRKRTIPFHWPLGSVLESVGHS